MGGWKNIFHANGKQKKAGVTILMLHKIYLTINITRDNKGHYRVSKGSILEEDIIIVNIYAPSIFPGGSEFKASASNAGDPGSIKGETDSNTIIVGDFNTPLTPMDRSSKHKINKETQVLNDTLDELDLIDIFRTFHPNTEYTVFSSAHKHSPG